MGPGKRLEREGYALATFALGLSTDFAVALPNHSSVPYAATSLKSPSADPVLAPALVALGVTKYKPSARSFGTGYLPGSAEMETAAPPEMSAKEAISAVKSFMVRVNVVMSFWMK